MRLRHQLQRLGRVFNAKPGNNDIINRNKENEDQDHVVQDLGHILVLPAVNV